MSLLLSRYNLTCNHYHGLLNYIYMFNNIIICKTQNNKYKTIYKVYSTKSKYLTKELRISDLNIQMLSKSLHKKIFREQPIYLPSKNDIEKCILNLKKFGLWGKEVSLSADIDLDLPPLKGKTLDEHFRLLGESQCGIYKNLLSKLISINIPNRPKAWNFSPGWTKYNENGKPTSVEYPDCSALVFDIEVCVTEGKQPTLACAMSDQYWYSWCSNELIDSQFKNDPINILDIIPFCGKQSGNDPKVVIGHNVSFDRKAVQDEYRIEDSKLRFVDTMSMHIAVSGLVEEQRGLLLKNKKAEKKIRLPWMSVGSPNSLKDILHFYCKEELKKESRDIFVKGTLNDVRASFQELMLYCAEDVKATHKVLNKLLPIFFQRFSHPVTFAGMLEMGTSYLPVSNDWNIYTASAEDEYNLLNATLNEKLIDQALKALDLRENEQYKNNPWLWDLDWSLPKGRVKTLQNYPNWYRNLCKKNMGVSNNEVTRPSNMSTSLRIVPKLLYLTWKGYPLHFDKGAGWGFLKPAKILEQYYDKLGGANNFNEIVSAELKFPYQSLYLLCKERQNSSYKDVDEKDNKPIDIGIPHVKFVPLPHKNGEGSRVGNPLAKDFLRKLEDRTLSSTVQQIAELVLRITKTISYWKNNRDRILSQFVIWLPTEILPVTITNSDDYNSSTRCGAILPQVVTAGTITRRAVEKTWMTASNAYSDRIGSELKAMIKAPPGYHFVGADVDSQELWIASVLGDAYYSRIHGSTALGWMTLQGNKADGTDMHSKTAETVGISRNNAKVVNYARIYGAGLKFMQQLLKQFNPNFSDSEVKVRATKLFISTKGEKGWNLSKEGIELALETGFPYNGQPLTRKEVYRLVKMCQIHQDQTDLCKEDLVNPNPVWVGGSESQMFNCLESIARSSQPRTPVLGARITRALEPWCVDDQFLTSRVNWVVQSSAVDYLHLMLVCMRWLFSEYKINGRFSISIHDEVRYLVASEDRYRAALALHITNLLTRSYISMRLGLNDLPMSVAFFASVDIDKVLRKEPDMDCVTPSNPKGLETGYNISKGETLSIYKVIEKTNGSLKKN